MTELSVAVVSLTRTKRRRFLWAAWWTGAPVRHPFRKPDASNGGAATEDLARAQAEKFAGRTLTVIEPKWARAWNRILRGMPPWNARDFPGGASNAASRPAAAKSTEPDSLWLVLGVAPTASVADIKLAFRRRALVAHPDHGGDPAGFRALLKAYREALRRREKAEQRPKKR